MGLQDEVATLIAAERQKTFSAGPQWTLGQLISAAEALMPRQAETEVVFDFCDTAPNGIDSWRGSYAELALSYTSDGGMPLRKFVEILEDANGRTFEGYKGGDFPMDRGTPVWVANWGRSGNTGVVGLRDVGWQIVVETAWCEF